MEEAATMGITQAAVRSIRNIWSHGDDEYEREEIEPSDASDTYRDEAKPEPKPANSYKPTYGGGNNGHSGARRISPPVAIPLRGREKNIYTLKPKSQDEATIAADYLKTGSAVVLNLDDVDRVNAVRIIDFMSGVCYGLDHQGHAMKLGETIFLFTPGDFEISSDETDYGENPEYFFKDVSPLPTPKASAGLSAAVPDTPSPANVQVPPFGAERGNERPSIERPSAERRPWER
jgi:FtsZ-interacting cell division protein YlmF